MQGPRPAPSLAPNAPVARLRALAPLDASAEELGLDRGLGILTRAFAEQVAADTALVVLWDERDELAWVEASWGLKARSEGAAVRRGEGTIGRLLLEDSAVVRQLESLAADPVGDATGGARIVTVLGAPVRSPVGTAGALCAGFSRAPQAERGLLLWTAEAYAAVAGLCLDGTGLLGALTEAARRDHLTGCLNYGALRQQIDREISRCERHGRELACCFIDLDDFNSVNDEHGHLAGNRALTAAASALRRGVRGADLVARYGGDEFVVVLPETGSTVAFNLAQRLCAEIERATTSAIGRRIGASVGVGAWTPGCSTDALLERADHGLRIAKKGGGGGVIAAPAAPETPRRARKRSRPSRKATRPADGSHLIDAVRRLRAKRRARHGR